MLFRFLQHWRERRELVERDAQDLLTFLGDHAYAEARERARACRSRQDQRGFRYFSRVAVKIANETGYVIGEKVVDRYAAAEREPPIDPGCREIIAVLVDISQGIADLARGREATAQAVCARVWQVIELRPSPAAQDAVRELRAAIEALAAEPAENSAALSIGVYPLRAELAGQALQRFKAALLGSGG